MVEYSAEADSRKNYEFSEQVGHLLRKAYQRHMAIFQQYSCEDSLTAPQFVALCTIQEMGVCSITDIVKATAVDQATMRGVVERLKSKGWIHQESDSQDRRKVVIRLTESGEELVRRMVPCAVTITEKTMGNLNPAEQVALVYLLQKMNEQPAD
ncbi:MarR family winged helix-turn-helix transcriptional regulator [Oceanobacter mangrovi]|uniref:MarR family winged helix-turn-helix transcriptional regulator n=1 Tax=Oceanobacter mangrovi TaxID=2862510 RepID=UPI001C8DFCDC|nr:MarR family transcriptional regulator [Oceanobacter mangrovi]